MITKCPICQNVEYHPCLQCIDHLVSKEKFQIIECLSCGMRITKGFPAEESIGKYYETSEYISHSNTRQGFVNSIYHLIRSLMLSKKAKWVKDSTGLKYGKLLDIGSGTGYFANTMQNKSWVVSTVEKNENARKFAEEHFYLTPYPSIESFSANFHNTNETGLDVITLWHVLEHLENLNGYMEYLHSILKPEGHLIIAVPNYRSYDARKYKSFWAAYDVPRHIWHFASKQMKLLAEKHQFEVTSIKTMPFDGFYISMMSEKNKKRTVGILFGILTGLCGYIASLANKDNSSSLVYVLKKKQTPLL